MNRVAIDLGGGKSQVCIRREDGEILSEQRVPTRALREFLAQLPKSQIVMETCSEAFAIADAARAAGHDVKVVPATLVKQLGVGARGVKTDKRDAQALSAAACRVDLPSVHVRTKESRERLTRVGARAAMVAARTQHINVVRGWMRTQLYTVTGASDRFATNVREMAAEKGFALPDYVEGLLRVIDSLCAEIAIADATLEAMANENEVAQRLMSVPGVGPKTAMAFIAIVDEPERFRTAGALESYTGLTAGERSSSDRVRRTGITKAGSSMLRGLLTQASLTLRRTRPNDACVQWAAQVMARRGKQIATIALARKLVRILFAIWRNETTYQPTLGARMPQSTTTA